LTLDKDTLFLREYKEHLLLEIDLYVCKKHSDTLA